MRTPVQGRARSSMKKCLKTGICLYVCFPVTLLSWEQHTASVSRAVNDTELHLFSFLFIHPPLIAKNASVRTELKDTYAIHRVL